VDALAAEIERAVDRLADVARRTPLERDERLSELTGAQVWNKREDLQSVRSFKIRGAYNLLAQLDASERDRGVVCASAGNHAQGVAYGCRALGIPGCIFVPSTTPRQKRERIIALGGEHVSLVVGGDSYDEASEAAAAFGERTGAVDVPPFDDLRTIAGQGTVAIELVAQLLEHAGALPDVIVVPVGGGGLLAGVLGWCRARHPGIRVVGVEPAGAASVSAALAAGEPVDLEQLDRFVDGAAVRRAGAITTSIIAALDPELVAVDEGRVCTEMLDLYQTEGIVTEPAGALATAAVAPGAASGAPTVRVEPGQHVVCIVSGGNNDVSRYGEIVERSLVHEGLKHYFLVEFPQEPGALRGFLDGVLGPDDDITLFEYVKKNNRETGPALVGLELAAAADLEPLVARMEASRLTIERVPPGSPLFTFLVS
jgi:threonine dehydratase